MLIKHNGHEIEMYSEISKIPVFRFQEFNLNLLIDAGIGSDMQSFQDHVVTLQRLIDTDPEAAKTELMNMLQNVQFVLSRMSPAYNAFALLIKKINGEEIRDEDLTEEGIKRIVARVNQTRLPHQKILDAIRSIKKNDLEFEAIFPKLSDNVITKEFYSQLKERTRLLLEYIKTSDELILEAIDNIDQKLFENSKPKTYAGPKGLEVSMRKSFEDNCLLIRQSQAGEPKQMTVITFYRTLENIQAQIKQRKKRR